MSNPVSCCHPERFTCRGAAWRADLKPADVTPGQLAQIQALENRLGLSLVAVK